MTLYHGTIYSFAIDIVRNGINLKYSNKFLDFGPGFYTTPFYYHAAITAIRKTQKIGCEEPYIVKLNYHENSDLTIRKFDGYNNEWGQFILNNRISEEIIKKYNIIDHNRDSKYDICCGNIGDGEMGPVLFDVNTGVCLPQDVDFNVFVRENRNEITQYSFHTLRAILCVEVLSAEMLKDKNKYLKFIKGKGK